MFLRSTAKFSSVRRLRCGDGTHWFLVFLRFAGYLLGFGVMGCLSLYFLISLMSDSHDSLPIERIVSVLG